MSLSPAGISQKLRELRSLHIPTERDRELRLHLDRLLEVDAEGRQLPEPVRFAGGLETRGIAMIDGPGGGKTASINRLLTRLPALNPPDGPRWLGEQVPSPATLKSLGFVVMSATGIPCSSTSMPAHHIWEGIKKRLMHLKITVLWIDEAHDLFVSRSERDVDEMLKVLKSLMQREGAVIVILSGTERLREITSKDPQVDRRFLKVVPRPFVLGADEKAVGGLVASCAEKAGLGLDWSTELSGRLIHASRGRFGRTVETTINAIEQAFINGASRLGQVHFAEAWGMQEGCPWHENVFVTLDWSSRPLDVIAQDNQAPPPGRRKTARRS
jgi:hypothetical protein